MLIKDIVLIGQTMLSVNPSALIQLDPDWFWVGADREQHVVVFVFAVVSNIIKEIIFKIITYESKSHFQFCQTPHVVLHLTQDDLHGNAFVLLYPGSRWLMHHFHTAAPPLRLHYGV